MNILEKFLKNNNPQPDPIHERVENVQSVIEETDSQKEIARKKAVDFSLKLIEEHPEMSIGTFMQMLQDETSLTDNDIATIIKKLADIKSEKAVVAAVQSTSLPSEAIATIATEANISPDTAEKIVKEIDDEDIQKKQQKIIAEEREKQILEQLSDIYINCENIEYQNVEETIKELRKEKGQDFTPAIEKKIMSIVAKRAALDCMTFGNARIYSLTQMMPSLEMFESDLPTMANNEYKNLKADFDDQGKTYKEFTSETKTTLYHAILEDIAKQSAENFDRVGDFALPQTDKFKKLSPNDINFFIKAVGINGKDIDKSALRRLKRQLNGQAATELQDLNSMLKKMNPQDRDAAIQNFVSLLRNGKIVSQEPQPISELDRTIKDIEINIKKLPQKSQLKSAQAILETLHQRNEASLLIENVKHSKTDEVDR